MTLEYWYVFPVGEMVAETNVSHAYGWGGDYGLPERQIAKTFSGHLRRRCSGFGNDS